LERHHFRHGWLSCLGVNYSDDTLTNDIVEHGPILDVVFRF